MLDIIVETTSKETATATPPTTTTQQPPIKSPNQTLMASNKRKRAQPSGDIVVMQASEELETKKAKSNQPKPWEAAGSPSTSLRKKAKKSVAAAQISPRKSAWSGAQQ